MKGGILFNEFDQIFYDSISSEADIYRKIVLTLAGPPLERQEIMEQLKRTPSGDMSKYLDNLIAAGFITRDYTWHVQRKKISKIKSL